MARTNLQLVNDVLIRLRESPVSTVSQTPYSSLVGAFINDAKREVEDSWQWSCLLDTLSFNTIAGISSYETNIMVTRNAAPPLSSPPGANDRTRLWIDNVTSDPLLYNTTLNQVALLKYQPALTDQGTKLNILNQPTVGRGPPAYWQVAQSTFYNAAGMWNKVILLYALPDQSYSMTLYVVNPQNDLVNDSDIMKIPTAPVVQKAYLYCLYERGEELGESLELTAQKVETTVSDAISMDQQFSQQYLALTIPIGSQY